MSKFNVGDTVYYLSGTETYRFIRSGTVGDLSQRGCRVEGYVPPTEYDQA